MYINKKGNPVITKIIFPPGAKYSSKINFDCGWPFMEGMAIVEMNDRDRMGYINTKGELIIPCIYSFAKPFCYGYAQVKLPNEEGFFLINKKGKAVTGKYSLMSGALDGYCIVYIEDGDASKCGVLELKTLKYVVPAIYEECMSFVLSQKPDKIFGVKLHGKWGFVNANGKMIIPCQYQKVGQFGFGLCAVKKDGYWFYINTTGKRVTPVFDKAIYAQDFKTDNLAVVYYGRQELYDYIYRNGDSIFPAKVLEHYTKLNRLRDYIEIISYKKMLFPLPLKILDNRKQNEAIKEFIKKNIPGLSDSLTTLVMVAEMCRKNNDPYHTLDIYNYIIKNEKLTSAQTNKIKAIINKLNGMEKHRVNYHFE